MFDPKKRGYSDNLTVEELCNYLLQNANKDARVTILGDPIVYIHIEEDRSVVCLDDNSLSDLPEYENAEDATIIGKDGDN